MSYLNVGACCGAGGFIISSQLRITSKSMPVTLVCMESFPTQVLHLPAWFLIAGDRLALSGGEHLERPEHAERLAGPLRPGPGALGQAHPVVAMELHPPHHRRGQVARQTHQPG